MNELQQLMPEEPRFKILTNQCNDTSDSLKSLYSFRLGRGSDPVDKPKIIRETDDQWQYMGNGQTYNSPIAAFLHAYIALNDPYMALFVLDDVHGDRVKRNCDSIDQWVRQIGQAHRPDSELYEHFPIGNSVATENIQRAILGFHDGDLEEMLKNTEADDASPENVAAAVYSILLLSHYLLNRCGINCLRPTYEDSGFDMFQSLNTTGTPSGDGVRSGKYLPVVFLVFGIPNRVKSRREWPGSTAGDWARWPTARRGCSWLTSARWGGPWWTSGSICRRAGALEAGRNLACRTRHCSGQT